MYCHELDNIPLSYCQLSESSRWSDFLETPPPSAFSSSHSFVDPTSPSIPQPTTSTYQEPQIIERNINVLPPSEGTYVQYPDHFYPDTYNFEGNLCELPSRCIQLANLPQNTTPADLDYISTLFGDVQLKDYSKIAIGVAIIQFYSMEDSQLMRLSLISIRNKKISLIFRPEDYNLKENISKDHPENNGTIVIFHLPYNISDEELANIFGQFGRIRQIRHTPYKESQRFIEYYDIRSAKSALEALNGKSLGKTQGKSKIAVEFSLPGGFKKNIQKFYRSNLPTIKRNSHKLAY